jgi:hypothetical protein
MTNFVKDKIIQLTSEVLINKQTLHIQGAIQVIIIISNHKDKGIYLL